MLIKRKGYGFARFPHTKATGDTQYFTGSTTKAFTAAAAALLVHDDKYPEVAWTSPISQFIPGDFALEDPHATTHTTIEDALSHRSGLPRHDLMYGQPGDTPSSVVQRMRYLPMTEEPRTVFQYCNIMFGVITDLVETITGRKLDTVLRDNFWAPLGMMSTTFTVPSVMEESSRLARGYYWDPPKKGKSSASNGKYVPEPYIDISPISGAGSTISTVNDYALWVKAWLGAGLGEDARNSSSPVTQRIFHDLLSPRTIVATPPNASRPKVRDRFRFIRAPTYALGWASIDAWGEPIVFHGGGLTGFGTELYMFPGRSYGVVTMGNTAGTSNMAGAIITSRLLRDKINSTRGNEISGSEFHEALIEHSKMSLRPSKRRSRQLNSPPKQESVTSSGESFPLPCRIEDFAGQYSHPAYGTVNLTLATSPSSGSKSILECIFHRTWTMRMQLFHLNHTVFAVQTSVPHGLGDVYSGYDIVWEYDTDEDERAVFELGLDGSIDMMGIELDEEMVDRARAKGPKYWREALVWFEKV